MLNWTQHQLTNARYYDLTNGNFVTDRSGLRNLRDH